MPDLLITFICDEWDRGRPFRKDTSQNEGEDILSVEINERLKGKARDDEKRKWKPKKRGSCWECGSTDHWKKDYPTKKDKRGNRGNSPKNPSTSVNIAEEDDDCSFVVEDDEGLAIEEVSNVMEPSSTRVEVFDSSTTTHISPYRSDFTTFEPIPPKVLHAANKQGFCAIGKGEMVLDLPNGDTTSKLRLSEVLYSPEAGYTLVSIGRLNDAGFSATFASGRCVIRDDHGARVAEIPRNGKGLYKIVREGNEVNALEETLTLDQLHRRLGHISASAARKLVSDGLVTGLKLEGGDVGDFFCESCAYGCHESPLNTLTSCHS